MDLDHERRLTTVEEQAKSNSDRLGIVEKRQDELGDLVSTVKVLAEREHNVEKDVKEIKNDVKTLNAKPGKRWEGIVDKILTALAGGLIAYFLSQIGM